VLGAVDGLAEGAAVDGDGEGTSYWLVGPADGFVPGATGF
jgi:hypothetical protein